MIETLLLLLVINAEVRPIIYNLIEFRVDCAGHRESEVVGTDLEAVSDRLESVGRSARIAGDSRRISKSLVKFLREFLTIGQMR